MNQDNPRMRRSISHWMPPWMHTCLGLVALIALAAEGPAQQGIPHLGYSFPAGGQRGTSFEIDLGGQYLKGSRAVIISGEGVEARVISYCKPPNRGQANKIRQKLREMWKAEQAKRKSEGKVAPKRGGRAQRGYPIAELDADVWKKIALSVRLTDCSLEEFIAWAKTIRDPKRQPNAQLEEIVTLGVTIRPDAEPGRRELRLVTGRGLTHPIYFEVGTLKEHSEQEPNDLSPDSGMENRLPILINGQILPGEVDRFSFTAKKRSRIVASVSARQLIPYLADAVPGWFQATLSIYDESGQRLAYVDDYKFHPDPVLSFEVPADGNYIIEIKDSIYRGREDFVYRLSLGEIPFATSAWPLGARVGTKTKIRLKGWNLPKSLVTVTAPEGPARISSIASVKGRQSSNSLPLALDNLEECFESEPNNSIQAGQAVHVPLLINGRIREPEDQDFFRFEAQANETYCFEVLARRLGSPLDSLLQIKDPQGRVLASNDDYRDEEAGLTTHHADSRLLFRAPADGRYFIRVSDTQHKGSMEHSYRLRMTRQQPDFALRFVPASLNLRAGTSTPITVHALRKDGFDGEIRLQLLNAPPGFRLDAATIPTGVDKLSLTLTVPSQTGRQPFRLHLIGKASIKGQDVQRPVIPAEDMMQAFLWRHLVPSQDLWALVQGRGRGRGQSGVRLLSQGPVGIQQGASTWLSFRGPKNLPWKRIKLELVNPPKGFRVGKIEPQSTGNFRFEIFTDKSVPLDLRGNLLLQAFLENPPPKGKKAPRRQRRRNSMGFLPAIPFQTKRRTLSF